MKKADILKAIKEVIEEKRPGLWANIRAKRARGEKPAHKNSNAHKDAVKAGKKINKSETKEAPSGHYFTKSGNLVKGTMSADAKERGARKSDPKDKTRSKVPKATQYKEAQSHPVAEKRAHRILSPKDQAANDAKFDKRMSTLKDLKKGQRLHKAGKISDEDLHNLKVKAGVVSAVKKEGLWANINAKKKAGKKPAHGNSNAHKAAEKAGKKLKP